MNTSTFIGVYSSLSAAGTKEDRDAGKRKQYCFVWDCGDAGYRVQSLDNAFQPQGEALSVDPSAFRASFSPEPSILAMPVARRRPVSAAPLQPQDELPPAAAPERHAAGQAEVETYLRAHFGSLLLKIRRGDDLAATLKALQDLAEVEEGIVPAHKYMFADFGINLRKGKLPEIALAHARRVVELAPGDSHAHFNIARVYHVLGKLGEAEQHLLTALEFSPDLGYARDFLAYIGKERRRKKLDARKGQRH